MTHIFTPDDIRKLERAQILKDAQQAVIQEENIQRECERIIFQANLALARAVEAHGDTAHLRIVAHQDLVPCVVEKMKEGKFVMEEHVPYLRSKVNMLFTRL
jgi:hypothetical protein